MIVKRGDKGPHVIVIQKAYKAIGLWPMYIPYSENFGSTTDRVTRTFQKINGLVVDGKLGPKSLSRLGVRIKPTSKFDEKYKGKTIIGSHFPDKPISWNTRVRLNSEILNIYIPIMEEVMRGEPRGFRLLITIMAYKEGFRKGPPSTRSYRHNNPGNIGNVDSGANQHMKSLLAGIALQKDYVERVASNRHKAYPMGEVKVIKPYFSKEISKHTKLYGMSPYVPGYKFTFTGQLDQYVKIYATGPRAGNGYVNMIISYFKKNGIAITPQSKIQNIIRML